jgi:hypothetical protein
MPLNTVPDGISVGAFGAKRDKNIGQRTDHVVFIPWAVPDAQEWIDKSNQWNVAKGPQAGGLNKFEVVVYDPVQNADPVLARISADPAAVLYIRGHGNPGSPYIQVKVNNGGAAIVEKKLPINGACQRLIDMGLQTGYAGAIKFYSCYSGTVLMKADRLNAVADVQARHDDADTLFTQGNFTAQQRDAWKAKYIAPLGTSLAAQGANYLRQNGFTHCFYYGYLGPLGAEYDQDPISHEWHKTVQLNGLHNAPQHLRTSYFDSTIKVDKQVRPSVARVRV